MKYKGYQGSVEYSAEDGLYHGKVQFIKSLLMYEGKTLNELKKMFHCVVDEYLQECKEDRVQPNVPYSKVNF